jgi:hypothetical protein
VDRSEPKQPNENPSVMTDNPKQSAISIDHSRRIPDLALVVLEWSRSAILETWAMSVLKIARTLIEHAEGVLRWFWSGFSNGPGHF